MRVEIQKLHKNYQLGKQTVPVLKGVEAVFPSGEMVSITGTSGVGKSTLLHLLGALDTPSEGLVKLDGVSIFEKSPNEIANYRNKNIGFVFQFHHLLQEFTALENVTIPLLIRKERNLNPVKEAKKWLDKLGLSHRYDHKPGELSGGEQQRVALARSLVINPKLLLADEPTGNLDESTGRQIIDTLLEVNKADEVTIILVTHNSNIASIASTKMKLTKSGLLPD